MGAIGASPARPERVRARVHVPDIGDAAGPPRRRREALARDSEWPIKMSTRFGTTPWWRSVIDSRNLGFTVPCNASNKYPPIETAPGTSARRASSASLPPCCSTLILLAAAPLGTLVAHRRERIVSDVVFVVFALLSRDGPSDAVTNALDRIFASAKEKRYGDN